MKKLLILLLCLQLPCFLFADLDDFREAVEAAENEDAPFEYDKGAESEDDEDNPFFQLFFDLFRFLWLVNNTTTTYGAYPYSDSGYICLADIEEVDMDDRVSHTSTGYRNHWFRADVQAVWMRDMGYGTWISFKSHLYRFFGPYVEDWLIVDGTDYLNGLRVGATFSLFQSDPISLSLYGQWTRWSGVLERSGGTFGIEFDSFFLKPFALHGKAGVQAFPAFSIAEYEVQAGFFLNNVELLLGYRDWSLDNTAGETELATNGVFTGVRLYY